jgi:UDP-N-acetylmuramyl pentapeptide phosphotransferase/UDP-N-acetylglucosamine-1-phosphate transferase
MEYLIFLTLTILITFIANKKKLLLNYSGSDHQKFLGSTNTPLIGGFFLLFCFLKVFYDKNIYYNLSFLFIFFVGFSSDSKLLTSPKIRFFLQLFIVSFFIIYFNIHVTPTRIEIVDNFFQNNTYSLIFSIFCFMILINGSNFIDGLNGLSLAYFLIVFLNLEINELILIFEFLNVETDFILFSLLIILVLNYFNFLFLGDAGSYLLAFFSGFFIVSLYNSTETLSPYYIILLFWYPCFEILFSLIRKYLQKKSPLKPDNEHLHQLVYLYFKTKINTQNTLISNVLSSIAINSFNFVLIFLASKNPNITTLQVKLIISAVVVYCATYALCKKIKV